MSKFMKFRSIAGKISEKIGGKIKAGVRSIFSTRPKKPIAPPQTRLPGHRGIAAGSLKHRQELREQGLAPYTAEEMTRWHTLANEDIDDFLTEQTPLFVNSSNVVMAQYFPVDQKLLIEFKKGAAYLYSSVSPSEARSFAFAKSKGSWVWSYLRVRGSRTAHQKPYVRVSGGIATRKPKPTAPSTGGITLQQLLAMDPTKQQGSVRLSDDEVIRLLNEEMRRNWQ